MVTTHINGQNSADLDPGRGPAYLAKPVRDGPKKWSPKSCFSDHISRDCLNKRLVSLFKHVLKQRLRRNKNYLRKIPFFDEFRGTFDDFHGMLISTNYGSRSVNVHQNVKHGIC